MSLLEMKCRYCGYEDWTEADIASSLAMYNKKTKKYEILHMCLKCEGTMQWHNKERKTDKWEDSFDLDNLPL